MTEIPLNSTLVSYGEPDYGTRYGKPRRSPKEPRKLKKRRGRWTTWTCYHVVWDEAVSEGVRRWLEQRET